MRDWKLKTPPLQCLSTQHLDLTTVELITITINPLILVEEETTITKAKEGVFSPNHFSQYSPNQGSGPRPERPTCQIYGKVGHIAINCYHRMDYAYQGKHPPTKLAAMVTSSNSMIAQKQPWLADSAATDHVTSSLNHLSFLKPYNGQDHLTVGNGQSLPITHIGNTLIPSSNSTIQLRNVLRVPTIASNLASVHKIYHDNQCWCYFDENTLSI